ncbi:threonine/serine exporter family protein [Aeribacillus pallidus]|jgi:uncharacterized membrane protein YjjB (DUF3815 family)|uniref:threonine/serine exporter family protein n=1 Tax=Aeribacillus pallidus TaxID=33936 RepID=UPI001DF7167E|nr:threonine/serine exporter family protein [Bacillus sp. (in: firmicutes)]
MIWEQLVTSFIASSGFGIIFNVPNRSLIKCGFVGMVGWMIYFLLVHFSFDPVFSTFMASLAVAILSQLFAKVAKMPMIIFSVSGIIPLVPGGLAYDAMRHFVINDYNGAIQLAAKAFLISGAIAVGLVFSEAINQYFRNRQSQ